MSWGIFGGIGIGLPPIMHFGLPGDVAKQDAVLKGCLSGDKVRGGICATDGGIRMTLPTTERIRWQCGGSHYRARTRPMCGSHYRARNRRMFWPDSADSVFPTFVARGFLPSAALVSSD